MDLFNKVVIITGASKGIGKETALLFASKGAKLVLNSKNEILLQEVKDKIIKLYPTSTILLVPGDITSEQVQKQLIDLTINNFQTIDILINNAGGNYFFGSNLLFSIHDMNKIFELNCFSSIYLSLLCIPYMIKQKNGCIINISSVYTKYPNPYTSIYSSAKASLDTWSKGIAAQFGKSNIRCIPVSIGCCETELTIDPIFSTSQINDIKHSLLQRSILPCEIASSILFLATNSYINGKTFEIDGGYMTTCHL